MIKSRLTWKQTDGKPDNLIFDSAHFVVRRNQGDMIQEVLPVCDDFRADGRCATDSQIAVGESLEETTTHDYRPEA